MINKCVVEIDACKLMQNPPLIGPSAASLANDVRSLPEYPEVFLLNYKPEN